MAKNFSIDARAMLTWGRESIKDHTTAVLELVKNSYDASATIVEVQVQTSASAEGGPFIRIADDGIGMSAADVENSWLRLGYSAKREERFTSRGRRRTGEKGVGRISADRLGAILELRSQALRQQPTGLRVNWNEFEKPGRDLDEVPVLEIDAVHFRVPKPTPWNGRLRRFEAAPQSDSNSRSRSGTELLIRQLRQTWDELDIQDLRRLLSLLTPPFEQVKDFQVRVETDLDPKFNGLVESPLMQAAAIEAQLSMDATGTVKGKLIHRSRESTRRIETAISLSFEQLVHPKLRPGSNIPSKELIRRLGPVSASLLFYPQKAETVRGLDIELSDLRSFLDTNAGVRVYRDKIRVPPYGDQGRPEGDWLALGDRKARNPAGPNRPDFRVSPIQLVGAVFIGRDTNPELVDTSGREGLVSGEALGILKSFLIGCLVQLEAHYHKLFAATSKIATEPLPPSPRETVSELRAHLSELAATIKHTEESLPSSVSSQMSHVAEQLASTSERLKRAEKTFEELASQAAVSRTLATIGIATATFGHETQRGLDSMRATLEAAKLLLQNGEDPLQVLSELEKAIFESEQVAAWGAFALGRVRRDKRVRRIVDVAAIATAVLNEILPAMEASSITLSRDLETVTAKLFAMDVECIIINLLTNAYYFSKQSTRDRLVDVRLKRKTWQNRHGFELVVADSGPGVTPSIRDRIWDPLFTTKTDNSGKAIGTGLGLALVNAVVQDTSGERTIDDDTKLGGARFAIWLPDSGA